MRKVIGVFLGLAIAVGAVLFALTKFDIIEIDFLEEILNKGQEIGKGMDEEIYCKEVNEENVRCDEGILYANNQLSLIAKADVPKKAIKKLAKQYDAKIVGCIEFTGDYQLEFKKEKSYEELNSIVDNLQADPNIESASLLRVMKIDLNEEKIDESYGIKALYPSDKKWNSWNKLKPGGNNWGLEAIRAPEAWALKNEMSSTKIGILDGEVDKDHEDLNFKGVYKFNASDEDKEHATHVAGIIGAEFSNDKGISGMCPKAELYSFNIFSEAFISDMNVKCGLAKVILKDVKVINCSFGSGVLAISTKLMNQNIITNQEAIKNIQAISAYFEESYTEFLYKFINEGYDFLIVHSAGNENGDYYRINDDLEKYPFGIETSEFPKDGFTRCLNVYAQNDIISNISDEEIRSRIIVVGACAQDGDSYKMCDFSNIGSRVDVLAPGEKIYSTLPDNKYGNLNGTSMSAPYVSGLAGMIWGINKDLPARMVNAIILATADIDVKNTDKKMINAIEALRLAKLVEVKNDSFNSKKGIWLATIKEVNDRITEDKVVEGARVTVLDKNKNTVEVLTSDREGGICLYLEPGVYSLVVEKEGYIRSTVKEIEVKRDDIKYSKISIKRASKVTGRIVDEDDESPLKDVVVKFKAYNKAITVSTDENGSFTKSIPYGTHNVVVYKNGYQSKSISAEIYSENTNLETIKLKKAISLKEVYLKKLAQMEKEQNEDPLYTEPLTMMEMNKRSGELYEKWDDMLNEIYGVLKKQLSASEMESLRIKQRAWIKYRDQEAEKERNEYYGGSMMPLMYNLSRIETTKNRCYLLVEDYMK